jgi:hypothetical protein
VQRLLEISKVSSVAELVEDDNLIGRVFAQEMMDKIGADETSSTGDKNPHG